ncbi:MAG: hypothetical protein PHY45_18030 [Rhodocyclaceae bacterium]|nr:hypothetical protein [Rhodocyclaceae bacterium]
MLGAPGVFVLGVLMLGVPGVFVLGVPMLGAPGVFVLGVPMLGAVVVVLLGVLASLAPGVPTLFVLGAPIEPAVPGVPTVPVPAPAPALPSPWLAAWATAGSAMPSAAKALAASEVESVASNMRQRAFSLKVRMLMAPLVTLRQASPRNRRAMKRLQPSRPFRPATRRRARPPVEVLTAC